MEKITADNIGVKFTKTRFKYFTLKAKLAHLFTSQRTEKFWALRNLDFHINEGETFGIIGPNGAGKSTLLKVIGGLMEPDEGTMVTKGRISTLLALGAGFQPRLSGRENIYINASLLGYTTDQIRAKEQDIIDYSELGNFIDSMVMFYSSGMKVRLGFAIATAFDPQILVVDEVLAVGDENFKKKSFERMQEFREQDKTIVVVSHNLGVLNDICSKMMLLEQGQKVLEDEPKVVIGEYLSRIGKGRKRYSPVIYQSEGYELNNFRVLNQDGNEQETFKPDEKLKLQFDYIIPEGLEKVLIKIIMFNRRHDNVKERQVYHEIFPVTLDKDISSGTFQVNFDTPLTQHGEYFVSIGILKKSDEPDFHFFKNKIIEFKVSTFKEQDKDSILTIKTGLKILEHE